MKEGDPVCLSWKALLPAIPRFDQKEKNIWACQASSGSPGSGDGDRKQQKQIGKKTLLDNFLLNHEW